MSSSDINMSDKLLVKELYLHFIEAFADTTTAGSSPGI